MTTSARCVPLAATRLALLAISLGCVANLGRVPARRGACDPRCGLLQEATAAGSDWRTDRGLRVGDTRAEIRARYPRAGYHRGAWWLEQIYVPFADGGDVPTLAAMMGNRAIRPIYIYVGAAGE